MSPMRRSCGRLSNATAVVAGETATNAVVCLRCVKRKKLKPLVNYAIRAGKHLPGHPRSGCNGNEHKKSVLLQEWQTGCGRYCSYSRRRGMRQLQYVNSVFKAKPALILS